VDQAAVEWLATPAARDLLSELPPYDERTALAVSQQLRDQGLDPQRASAIVTQSRLRTRARERWGDIVDELILTPDGAEQATRPAVAAHRARRYVAAGLQHVADLSCGLGLDALSMAAAGLMVTAYESDPATAAAARANATALALRGAIGVHCADVTALDVDELRRGIDAVFADPARRRLGRRISQPERWSPRLSWVLALPMESLGVKVAPGLAHDAVPAETEFEVVSVDGDVVEAGLYRGALRTARTARRATLLPSGQTLTDADLPAGGPPVGGIGAYLYEPDGAVIRSGLVGAVVTALSGRLLDPAIAYVTSDELTHSPFVHAYRVCDVRPFNLKILRALLRERGVGRVTIKKRGSAVVPEQLRKQRRLDRTQTGEATIVLTRVAHEPLMILVEPMAKSASSG